MITDYMENLKVENPFTHLKPWQKTPYEKQNGKYIYKNGHGSYLVQKRVQGKTKTFGTFQNFPEAVKFREELIKNDWEPLNPEEDEKKEYFKNVYINSRHYHVSKNGQFYGSLQTLEEALYYRDICRDHDWDYNVKPQDLDLITDNPYLTDGLCYSVPERLVMSPKVEKAKGRIVSHGEQSHRVFKADDYYGSYRTFEMAYYVKQELNKCNWDKSQLDKIVEDYPLWYTKLMNLYKFVNRRYNGYVVSISPKHSSSGKLENIYFNRLEDALWERDLLLKYDWNEELLIECADDTKNPYYDMELPPYPQRKVRNLSERKDRTMLFNKMYELIQCEEDLSQGELCERCGLTSANLRMILLNEYDTNWTEFKRICESGENPNDVMVQKPLVYKPDLDIHYKNTNYVSYHKKEASPYLIYHKDKETRASVYFGTYPTRELANKISNDLQKVNWDKSKLKEIQAKHGWQSPVNSKRYVVEKKYTSKKTGETYTMHYGVRKKNIGSFGTYKDKRVAELVRDLLILYDWDKAELCWIQDLATYTIEQADNNWRCRL